jgi:hypothetical protein
VGCRGPSRSRLGPHPGPAESHGARPHCGLGGLPQQMAQRARPWSPRRWHARACTAVMPALASQQARQSGGSNSTITNVWRTCLTRHDDENPSGAGGRRVWEYLTGGDGFHDGVGSSGGRQHLAIEWGG